MRSIFLSALLAAAAGLPSLAQASLPFTKEVVELDNGLRLVMVPYDSPGIVAYYSLVRVGSRDEVEKGVTGFAHFFEHMMFRGTEAHPHERVQALLKKTGADQNGFTTDDFTCYTFLGSSKYLEELVAYEADRFQNLKYSKEDFKTEAGAVLGEYRKNSSHAYLPLIEKLRASVFKAHTYGHTTLGYLADIEDMPNQYDYSLSFFKRFYTPDNLVLIVVGDFDAPALTELVKKHYSPWKLKRDATKTQIEPPQTKPVRAHVDFPAKTLPKLSVSWRVPGTDLASKETAVYNILYELLFGETSKVYTELVLEKQLVQSIENWTWANHRDPYLFHAVASVKSKENLAAVEARFRTATKELVDKPVDAAVLDAVKSRARYSLLLSMATPDKIALVLAEFIAPTGDVDGLERLLDGIQALTPADIQDFAKKYLVENNESVLTLVTKEDAEAAK